MSEKHAKFMNRVSVCRRPFLFGIIALFAFSLAAQAQTRAIIQVGIAGSTLRGNSDTNFSSITRFSGGAGLSFQLKHGFRLQAEVLYITKGAQADGEIELEGLSTAVPIEATFDLTYLEIPFLLVYQFNTRSVRPKLFAGPSIALRMDSFVTFRAVAGGPEFRESDDSVQSKDIGMTIGGGVEFNIGSEVLSLGLRTSLGFSNARTAKPALRNTSLGLFAGIMF